MAGVSHRAVWSVRSCRIRLDKLPAERFRMLAQCGHRPRTEMGVEGRGHRLKAPAGNVDRNAPQRRVNREFGKPRDPGPGNLSHLEFRNGFRDAEAGEDG